MTLSDRRRLRRRAVGVTLIELMVALAIGAFLMIGAVTVFVQARQTFRLTDSVARLQETGRFALESVEPEIRMAHYWGLTTQTVAIEGRAGPADANGLGPDNCGTNWTIDFDKAVEASNNGYTWACAAGPAGGNGAADTSDTLVVRRVSENAQPVPPALLADDTLYLQTRRGSTSRIFTGTAPPAEFLPITAAAPSETRVVLVTGYYVGKSSALGANMPSLRRKAFTGDTSSNVTDEEVLPGVEDLQVQFGVDTDPVGSANRGSIDRYVNPGDPILTPGDAAFIPDAEILAVRIWLRIRTENIEAGYKDTRTYVYADQNIPAPNDAYRRVVMSKTIYLRNARPAS
ncbi:MAG TPA: PilW family protein [Gammaproteobacteria bacterium]|nr:PilW family protein [Gammaproteobacteria bacterium]